MCGFPGRTLSISSSSLASVSVAPLLPMLTAWSFAQSRSMPSKLDVSVAAFPVTKVLSKSACTARAFSWSTAASRSWTLERVSLRKLSMSASPPRILREAVCWVKVGASSSHSSPTS